MSFFKLVLRVSLTFFLIFSLFVIGYSQGCAGNGGGGISGGAISSNLGILCANIDALGGLGSGAVINISAGNVFPGDNVSFAVIWDDGSSSPIVPAIQINPTTWELNNVKHSFPTTGPNVKCEYIPKVTLFINGVLCTANHGSSPKFARWNVDTENSGLLDLSETVTSLNVYPVCRGTQATVTFTDRSTLNCVPPEAAPNNFAQRWRRFSYGTVNTITSATGVKVSGVVQPYPFQGAVITENPTQFPLFSPETLQITIPDDAQVGEEFQIKMEYWNTCNPYDDPSIPGLPADLVNGDFPAVSMPGIIRIIDAPVQPIINDQEICFGDLPTTILSVTNIQPSAAYIWYPALLDAQNSTNAIHIGTTFTPTAVEAPIIGDNHYFVTATFGTSCISPPEDVVLKRWADINAAPVGILGDPDVCPNGLEVYSFLSDPATEGVGGATEYFWTVPPGWTLNSGQNTKSISVLTNGTLGPTALSVVRRYVNTTTSGSQCESNPDPFPITVRANPSALPLTPFNICEGDAQPIDGRPSNPFGTIAIHSWAGNTSILDATNVQVPNTFVNGLSGPYNLTYTVTNSIGCSGSVPVLVNIIPKPTTASAPTQQLLCSTLVSNPLSGNAPLVGTGLWTLISKPSGSLASNSGFLIQTDPNTIFTGDVFGEYILRWTITNGICSSSDDILIDFGSNIIADAGTANAFCDPSGSLNALSPIAGTAGKGIWSQIAGSMPNNTIFTNVNSNTSGISLIDPSAFGVYTYQWTVTSGSCIIAPDFVTITFNEPVIALDLAPTVCETTVASGIALGVDLTRYNDEVTGIVGSINRKVEWFISPPPALPITTPTNFDVSNSTLYTRVTNTFDLPNCTKDGEVTFTVNPLPTFAGYIGINQSVCQGGDPNAINELVPAFGGIGSYTYQWQVSDNNSAFVDVPTATNVTFDPPVVSGAGPYAFQRLVSSGACLSLASNIATITLNPLPMAILSAPRPKICEDEFFILNFAFTGTAPFYFDYNDGTTSVSNKIGANNTPIPIFDFQDVTTYTVTRLVDFNGCVALLTPNPSVTVEVTKLNTDFTFSPAAQCSGEPITFQWNADAGVEYTWIWNDGTPDQPAPVGISSIDHIFTSANSNGDTDIQVSLQAINNSDITNVCGPKISTQIVTIHPNIFINVFPDKDKICSGETVRFNNSSTGGDNDHWYYREIGTTTPIFDERNPAAGSTQDFTFTNTTTQNPIVYEMVYEVSNINNCSDFATYEIKVYREVTPSFDEGPVPHILVGGNATVEFSNTSTPIDANQFQYLWDFGADASPATLNAPAPPVVVNYSSKGEKLVRLTASNPDAVVDGLTTGCAKEFSLAIYIVLPSLTAAFEYMPHAACFPADIVITENYGTGNLFEWQLFNINSGTPLSESNDLKPTFKISNPGSYYIVLKTTDSGTNQSAFADNQNTPIEIFDLPFASFEARPSPVYVPDEKLILTNRSTDANTDLYVWDFDDGETSIEPEPQHTYALPGNYYVTLVAGFNHGPKDFDGDGVIDGDLICYDTTRQEITAKQGGLTRIPNAFTPSTSGPNGGVSGGRNMNDVFIPITKAVEEFEMQIFDRWGALIFESTNANVGWDGYDKNGILLPAGVYVYKLTLRLSNNQRTTQIGDLTLIR